MNLCVCFLFGTIFSRIVPGHMVTVAATVTQNLVMWPGEPWKCRWLCLKSYLWLTYQLLEGWQPTELFPYCVSKKCVIDVLASEHEDDIEHGSKRVMKSLRKPAAWQIYSSRENSDVIKESLVAFASFVACALGCAICQNIFKSNRARNQQENTTCVGMHVC